VIRSFKCKETAQLWDGKGSLKLPSDVQVRAFEKLRLLNAASNLGDLRIQPGNHLKNLRGKRKGQKSIRINDQWRICFEWQDNEAHNVEIVDYH
jgi:proteic killer suppression protein